MRELTMKCPYCFEEFAHDQVHFRSEKYHPGGLQEEVTPEWKFFCEKEDETYETFWRKYGGTTEYHRADDLLGIASYHRPIINPMDKGHQQYLQQQETSYYGYNEDGIATNIQLSSGEICRRRVCPNCHNPLPPQYGMYPVKFIAVVGITGAGKTVFLSQLLAKFKKYTTKVGLTAITKSNSAEAFVERNPIGEELDLPGATPAMSLQQPIFYDLVQTTMDNKKRTETIVLYDVAGECCVDSDLLSNFAPFIKNANGLLVLIDPLQFQGMREKKGETVSDITKVLEVIQNTMDSKDGQRNKTPVAICITKTDLEQIKDGVEDELRGYLLNEVSGIRDVKNHWLTQFHATEYNMISSAMGKFIQEQEDYVYQHMKDSYDTFNYFGFTSLGCDVMDGKPKGPILPKRIEEPLFWLFYQFGYITTDVAILEHGIPTPVEGQKTSRLFQRLVSFWKKSERNEGVR